MKRKRDWIEWVEEFADWILYIIILIGLFFVIITAPNPITN
jgi:hypothetical protein